jgi:hypothetical protein
VVYYLTTGPISSLQFGGHGLGNIRSEMFWLSSLKKETEPFALATCGSIEYTRGEGANIPRRAGSYSPALLKNISTDAIPPSLVARKLP